MTEYESPLSQNEAMGISQEHPRSASGEGSLPQTSARPVIFEYSNESIAPEATLPLRPLSFEHIDRATPPPFLREATFPPRSSQDEKTLESLSLSDAQIGSTSEMTPTPIPEQQLAFLRYLVSHGLINEGFEEGQVPEQYRRKRE
jgi:hypothetical protein